MLDLVWLIPALPLAGFALILLFGRRLGDPKAGYLATLMIAAGLDFVGPSINWFALSPMLVLFGAAMVLLVAGGLFPRWPPHVYALFTAAAGLASMILCFFLWDNITDGGAALLVGNALRFDVFTMIVTITISGALVLVAFVTDDYLRREQLEGPEVYALYMAGCADQVKRVTLELGGKSANIVFADADLEAAAAAAPGGVFDNSGQDCCARSRVLVERSVFDRFLELFVDAAAQWKVGDPMDASTSMGPLVTAQHLRKVRSFSDSLETVFTGTAPSGPGFWHPIMIATPTDPSASVCRDEIFGPVAVVLPFEDEADAVRICNDSDYGLSGSVWTGDGAKALRVVRAMEAGTISVNSNSSVRYSTPFGGFKQSGLGREHSMHVLDHYTELKNVFIAT